MIADPISGLDGRNRPTGRRKGISARVARLQPFPAHGSTNHEIGVLRRGRRFLTRRTTGLVDQRLGLEAVETGRDSARVGRDLVEEVAEYPVAVTDFEGLTKAVVATSPVSSSIA